MSMTDISALSDFWQVKEKIGSGSFGNVYRALVAPSQLKHLASLDETWFNLKANQVDKVELAIKVLDIGILPNNEDHENQVKAECAIRTNLEKVKREIGFMQSLQQFHHSNIVEYYGHRIWNGSLWMFMEYCHGGSIRDICQLRKKPLEEHHIAIILRETLQGLVFLHSHKKIHRDIKGGNILLTRAGQVKLADFGVSAEMQMGMDKRNTFIGTPYWMAPEVIKESEYDGRADCWSLGITAIEMAEMVPPNAHIHPMRALFKILRELPPTLKNQELWSSKFHDFLRACLVKDPAGRPTAAKLQIHPFFTGAGSIEILKELVSETMGLVKSEGRPASYSSGSGFLQYSISPADPTVKNAKSNLPSQLESHEALDDPVIEDGLDDSSEQAIFPDAESPVIPPSPDEFSEKNQSEQKFNMEFNKGKLPNPGDIVPVPISKPDESINIPIDEAMQTLARQHCAIQLPFLKCSDLSTKALVSEHKDFGVATAFQSLMERNKVHLVQNTTLTPVFGNILRNYQYLNTITAQTVQGLNESEQTTHRNLDLCIKSYLKI